MMKYFIHGIRKQRLTNSVPLVETFIVIVTYGAHESWQSSRFMDWHIICPPVASLSLAPYTLWIREKETPYSCPQQWQTMCACTFSWVH